jgi:peptide chain release factor 1
MKSSMLVKLNQATKRLDEVTQSLASEVVTKDLEQYRRLSREYAELLPITKAFNDWQSIQSDLATANDMLSDPELQSFAQTEIEAAQQREVMLIQQLNSLLLPRDPQDERNVFLEIRAGTGGDEAALFAAVLLRMYIGFAEKNRWGTDIVSANESDLGGYKEVILHITGQSVYAKMKFESGGHRVQRIPMTESQGRIHTSACTVAVLPEANEITKTLINPVDLRIDTFRASGAGGQHINKTDSAVRITHLPSGLVVECQDDRSQHRNKASALAVLAAKLENIAQQARQKKEAALRKNLIGSGDRSGRIRTYNFPQSRMTEHRINLTLYKLDNILNGELTEIIDALNLEYEAEQLTLLAN